MNKLLAGRVPWAPVMLLAMLPLLTLGMQAAEELIADFESGFGEWKTTGTAFGTAPATGTLPDQAPVGGYRGMALANSFHGGDRATGTLTSPEFTLTRRYLNFLIGGGEVVEKTCVNVVVDGQVVRSATGRDDEFLTTVTFDLGEFLGQRARIQMVDAEIGGWGHVTADHFVLSDHAAVPPYVQNPEPSREYAQPLRPQFHFTARSNWLNDPNGLVYLNGEYHLFFQHNPAGREWGNMTWGHAVSSNLVHWTQLDPALEPDVLGTVFSGSAVVDRNNTAGFQQGSEPVLIAFYTAAGGTSEASRGRPFTQCLAFSHDQGRTWTRFEGNPIVPSLGVGDRDPKVIWHEPSRRWIMPLYVGRRNPERPAGSPGEKQVRPELHLLTSFDLKQWTPASVFSEELHEGPGLVELTVDGNPEDTHWVLWGADGRYWICRFDGRILTQESGPHPGDHGANFYAAQAWDDLPDRRVVLLGWMRGGSYPGMPFNQQLSFPVELSLHMTSEGPRLVKWPVREIVNLFASVLREDLPRPLSEGTYPLPAAARELLDLELEFLPGHATGVTLELRGQRLSWKAATGELSVLDRKIPLRPTAASVGRRSQFTPPWGPDFAPWDNSVRLRILLDRTSLEVFASGGLAVGSFCFLPEGPPSASLHVEGGELTRARVTVRELKSAWPQ